MLHASQNERYSRQVSLPEFGQSGQEKLLAAKVLVIGAGGLGCPIMQYLTAAGVGNIGIADDDIVSVSNLHRQVLFNTQDVGKSKAVIASEKLEKLNPEVKFTVYNTRITNANAWEIISAYDLVIDGSDNFTTRYLINDACVLLNKPLAHGSIFRFEGQVSIFNYKGSANYRDIFAESPKLGEVPDCSEAGVIGVLAGIIGNLMANEAIKIITGIGTLLINRMLIYNSLSNTFYEIAIEKRISSNKDVPADRVSFEKMNYDVSCSTETTAPEINYEDFDKLIGSSGPTIIDVREKGETPLVDEFEHINIPMNSLVENPPNFTSEKIILFCQTGNRSRKAAEVLNTRFAAKHNILSLKGGILQWKKAQIKQTQ